MHTHTHTLTHMHTHIHTNMRAGIEDGGSFIQEKEGTTVGTSLYRLLLAFALPIESFIPPN